MENCLYLSIFAAFAILNKKTMEVLSPHYLSVIPFIGLLLMIATGPVLYPHFWHRYYVPIAIGLGPVVVGGYYVFTLGNYDAPVEALAEYIQFILLIASLYMVSGSILIKLQYAPTPRTNLGVLWTGAVLANFIGTTGASMLLIRPYIRLNKKRLSAYHIVFFIFMVSNVGGGCTPVADPPLFLGFLKGVPFFFTLWHGILPFFFALLLLSMVFYWLDRKTALQGKRLNTRKQTGITIKGARNFLLFIVILGAVFLDPHKLDIPYIPYTDQGGHVHHFSFIRELIFVGVILYVRFTADRGVLRDNNFTLEPLKEVVFIFIGIFFTMMPALSLIKNMATTHQGRINANLLYWATGILSSVLDNAPTYLNFLTAGMAAKGLHIEDIADVGIYAKEHAAWLSTTSIAAVFFGAMTYVGNGPNFMVRAIAEEQGLKMPSFGGYIWRYSIRFLLPVLCLVWLVFT